LKGRRAIEAASHGNLYMMVILLGDIDRPAVFVDDDLAIETSAVESLFFSRRIVGGKR